MEVYHILPCVVDEDESGGGGDDGKSGKSTSASVVSSSSPPSGYDVVFVRLLVPNKNREGKAARAAARAAGRATVNTGRAVVGAGGAVVGATVGALRVHPDEGESGVQLRGASNHAFAREAQSDLWCGGSLG